MEIQLNIPHLSRGHSWYDQAAIQFSSFLDSKVARVFFFGLVGAILTWTAAAIVALTFPHAVVLLSKALIPLGVAGAGIRLFVEWLSSGTTEEYAELAQVAEAYERTPRMIEAVRAVDRFVKTNPIKLDQSYDYHDFHHELTVITEQVKTRADLRGIWGTFLNRLEGRTIYQPDDNTITLHTGMERDRLEGRNIEVITERLDLSSDQFDRECAQMFTISQECFAGNASLGQDALRAAWRQPRNQIYVAKRRDTREVFGYVWTKEERDEQGYEYLHICTVARKAEACSIGVAHCLFQQVFAQPLNRFRSIYLEVRQSNRNAIALYSQWGFRNQGVHINYYTHPVENAYVMARPAARAIR